MGKSDMKVAVDAALCSGHGRCYSLAPEVFHADESGFCAQRGTAFNVSAEHHAAVRDAASNCPEGAIEVK